MTWRLRPLPDEIMRALADSPQALAAGSIRSILKAARGIYVADNEPGATLDRLVQEGKVERVTSDRAAPRYRLPKGEPQTAA